MTNLQITTGNNYLLWIIRLPKFYWAQKINVPKNERNEIFGPQPSEMQVEKSLTGDGDYDPMVS
jgi:hypothetical protein